MNAQHDSAEFLIQHLPLADVLAFVNAREDVRRMARGGEIAEEYDGPPTEREERRTGR